MIIFDLICNFGHAFEGWFQSQEVFEKQISQEMISCPHCGSLDIQRVPSAVHLAKNLRARSVEKMNVQSEENMALLGRIVSSIMANTEDVGRSFAEEARRIHYLEAAERPIRGEASFEEYESLKDEGIDVVMLPIPKKKGMH